MNVNNILDFFNERSIHSERKVSGNAFNVKFFQAKSTAMKFGTFDFYADN